MHISRLRRFALLVAGLRLRALSGRGLDHGRQPRSPESGNAVAVKDGLAYVGTSVGFDVGGPFAAAGLVIADVSNPSAPVEIGAIEFGLYYPLLAVRDVAIEGGLAYLAVKTPPAYPNGQPTGRLWIVDVSDSTAL